MKKIVGMGLLLAGLCCAAQAEQKVDYLKLTIENLPHMQVLIQAGLDSLDISDYSLAENNRHARLSALLPRFRVGATYTEDIVNNYEWVENYSESQNSGNPYSEDRHANVGNHHDRLQIYAQAIWDLDEAVWSRALAYGTQNLAREASSKRRRIVEIAKRYKALAAALPADSSEKVTKSDMALVIEHALYLDRVTGNYISSVLLDLERRQPEELTAIESAPVEFVSVKSTPVVPAASVAPVDIVTILAELSK